jgi:hypothetical protein
VKHTLAVAGIAWLLGVVLVSGRNATAAGSGGILFRLAVRDSTTGQAVVPDSLLVDGKDMAGGVDVSGRMDVQVCVGEHLVVVRASGYRELVARETAVEGDTPLNVLLLDPVTPPSGTRPEVLGLFRQPNSATIVGYVVDDASGKPLEGVEISVSDAGLTAVTDARGFFALTIGAGDGLAVPGDGHGGLYLKKALSVAKAGYDTQVWRDVLAVAGETRVLPLRLLAGQGLDVVSEQDSRGNLLGGMFDGRTSTDAGRVDGSGASSVVVANAVAPEPLSQVAPTTIRVGRNCPTKTTCSTVQTMSMDTYVKHVLPAEWFSSWNAESLKAGAVAIRSYGGWYVYHPLTSTYDICDTTSCQVYGNSTAPSSDAAVDATSGVYLVDSSGNIARAEYSAENNNSCGDCYITNNPSAACLYDPVCCGTALNGHGRGMCQWGTQRWATNQGKTYGWIVDHYYANFNWTRQTLGGPVITQQPAGQNVCPDGDGFGDAHVPVAEE